MGCCVRGLLSGDGVGWVHGIRANLTSADLDVPPDDAVTVTGTVGGPRCEEVAARVPRAPVEKGSISLWRSPDLPSCSTIMDNTLFFDRGNAATSVSRCSAKGVVCPQTCAVLQYSVENP